MTVRVLVVDDEENIRDLLRRALEKRGYRVFTAGDGQEGLETLEREEVQVCLVDLKMPVMDGMAFLKEVRRRPEAPVVIMMSAYGTYGTVVEAIREGAYDYVQKPFEIVDVLSKIEKVAETIRLREENERLRQEVSRRYSFEGMVGRSPAMREVFALIERVRDHSVTVLVQGETGTGKELVARSLHFGSTRREGPFVPVNCAAIPENLLEAELFGYRKGAFTDARETRRGLIEEADRGTLFLDEIGDLPLSMQAKILRVLQEGEVRRIGETENRKVDVRVIAATSRNLQEEVKRGNFREDLFYRINRVVISLPPLRERREDIPLLVARFLQEIGEETGKSVDSVDEEGMKILLSHSWPGNVRELKNVIERALLLCDEPVIPGRLISEVISGKEEEGDPALINLDPSKTSLKEVVRQVEKIMIERALRLTGGSRPKAAKLLGISHPALLYKIKEYDIN
ncbi:MAG: sigma-54-dependent Fis family transcriptional regulator [Deltaproteobacteria bacterium]|nr:MAG: sigma-54-dependent Fis family transcriptional regulator [Deltaproteobacteria bacterium]